MELQGVLVAWLLLCQPGLQLQEVLVLPHTAPRAQHVVSHLASKQ